LIDQGFLLAEDLTVILQNAGRHWDFIAASAPPSTVQR
jgi:hypothetical protein